MISFIIPAKNSSDYIDDCITPFLEIHDIYNFEVIFIDDNSIDETYARIKESSVNYPKINVFRNTGNGKVQALNYGYTKCKGDIIKCIDSDDVLLKEIMPYLLNQRTDEALIHDAFITDSQLNHICYFAVNPKIVYSSYEDTIREIISPPRCNWSFTRSIGNKIFPIPDKTPFEDVWFSFSIKKYSKRIIHIKKPFYLYRQHSDQVFGGVFNFSKDIVRFRAKRIADLLPIVKNSELGRSIPVSLFDSNIAFFSYIAYNEWTVCSYLRLKSAISNRMRFFLILFFPRLAQKLQSRLWKVRSLNK